MKPVHDDKGADTRRHTEQDQPHRPALAQSQNPIQVVAKTSLVPHFVNTDVFNQHPITQFPIQHCIMIQTCTQPYKKFHSYSNCFGIFWHSLHSTVLLKRERGEGERRKEKGTCNTHQ
jgi:hypothetical protein